MSAPVAVSLFSGLGGLDLGARIAGTEVAFATDNDATALDHLSATQGTPTIEADIRNLDLKRVLREYVGGSQPDLLIGGPPCTAFSHAGFWLDSKRDGTDPAADLLGAYVDALQTLRPRAFVMENVPGLLFKTHQRFYRSFINRVRRSGYSIDVAVLDSSDFSVAQARRRLFIVGVQSDLDKADLSATTQLARRPTRWAIGDIAKSTAAEPDERPRGKHSHWIADIPPGENYLALTRERGHMTGPFEYRSRYWSFLLKIHPDRPSPTIPAQRVTYNGPFHWTDRHLRLRELARLQGFPDWQHLDSDLNTARRHIGNAVPPLLAASVIRTVLMQSGIAADEDLPKAWVDVASNSKATFEEVCETFPLKAGEAEHLSRELRSTEGTGV